VRRASAELAALRLRNPSPNPTAIRRSLMAFVTTRAMARKRRLSPLHAGEGAIPGNIENHA